jgi:hypothetical protein
MLEAHQTHQNKERTPFLTRFSSADAADQTLHTAAH